MKLPQFASMSIITKQEKVLRIFKYQIKALQNMSYEEQIKATKLFFEIIK